MSSSVRHAKPPWAQRCEKSTVTVPWGLRGVGEEPNEPCSRFIKNHKYSCWRQGGVREGRRQLLTDVCVCVCTCVCKYNCVSVGLFSTSVTKQANLTRKQGFGQGPHLRAWPACPLRSPLTSLMTVSQSKCTVLIPSIRHLLISYWILNRVLSARNKTGQTRMALFFQELAVSLGRMTGTFNIWGHNDYLLMR